MTDTLKVTKINETWLHLDADLSLLQELEDAFQFFVPGYQHMPAFRNKAWDGKIRLISVYRQRTYVGLYKQLKEFCENRGYEFIGYDDSLSNITPKDIAEYVSSLNLHSGGKQIVFRDYQYLSVYKSLKYYRHLIQSPTGSGKSAQIYTVIRYLENLGKRVLLLVPTTSLVTQMHNDFVDYSTENGWKVDDNVQLIFEGRTKVVHSSTVISTWQSLQSRFKIQDSWFEHFDAIIVDECFSPKTRVLTISGWKPICHLAKTDKIYNINKNNEVKIDEIVKIHTNLSNEQMFELEFDNGTKLHVTGNHKLMMEDGSWKRADEITFEDDIKWVNV